MRNPVGERDRELGEQLRMARVLRKISQREMAKRLNISQQQLYKYESGSNRVTVSQLEAIAAALGVPVLLFFPGSGAATLPLIDRRVQQLVGNYGAIGSERLRKLLLHNARVFAEE